MPGAEGARSTAPAATRASVQAPAWLGDAAQATLAALLAGGMWWLAVAAHGFQFSPDRMSYASLAHGFLPGHPFTGTILWQGAQHGRFQAIWPPLYPALIAAVHLLGPGIPRSEFILSGLSRSTGVRSLSHAVPALDGPGAAGQLEPHGAPAGGAARTAAFSAPPRHRISTPKSAAVARALPGNAAAVAAPRNAPHAATGLVRPPHLLRYSSMLRYCRGRRPPLASRRGSAAATGRLLPPSVLGLVAPPASLAVASGTRSSTSKRKTT